MRDERPDVVRVLYGRLAARLAAVVHQLGVARADHLHLGLLDDEHGRRAVVVVDRQLARRAVRVHGEL